MSSARFRILICGPACTVEEGGDVCCMIVFSGSNAVSGLNGIRREINAHKGSAQLSKDNQKS